MAQKIKKYYINVELRDYNDNVVGYSTCNLDTDISSGAITDAVRVAGELMVKYHTGVANEQQMRIEELERQIANVPGSEN